MDYSQLNILSKTGNTIGSLSQIEFNIKPVVADLDYNSNIIIFFPRYYSPTFSLIQPLCLINDVFSRCEFTGLRLLKIKDIPVTLTKGISFKVIVNGLAVPSFSTLETIFVALDSDGDETKLLEFGEISDIAIADSA